MPRRSGRRDNPEAREQRALAKWLDAIGVLWCAVPNGGNRDKVTGANLKAEGAKAGVPDVLIFTPPPLRPNAHGVALELKAPEGAKPSDEQMAWLEALAAQGWLTAWARLSPGITDGWWWLRWTAKRGTVCGCTVDADTLELALLTTGLRLVVLDGAEVVA